MENSTQQNTLTRHQIHYQRYRNTIINCVQRRRQVGTYYDDEKAKLRNRYQTDPEYQERKKRAALERYYRKKYGIEPSLDRPPESFLAD